MAKLIFYHGTSEDNARKIMKEGFKVDGITHNWGVRSKQGFVYFSLGYAPFYAMQLDADTDNEQKLALIQVAIDEKDLYPEDDFIMYAKGKGKYEQEEIDAVDFEEVKHLWVNSVKFLGNVCARPDKIKILGVRYFFGRDLMQKCDPVITPMNYKIMGDYYRELTKWIFDGNKILDFKRMF